MEFPVKCTPLADIAGIEGSVIGFQDCGCTVVVIACEVGHCTQHEICLEHCPQLEELDDLIERECRHDSARVRAEGDQALNLELTQGLTHRDPAHTEVGGQRILP